MKNINEKIILREPDLFNNKLFVKNKYNPFEIDMPRYIQDDELYRFLLYIYTTIFKICIILYINWRYKNTSRKSRYQRNANG